MGYLESLSAQSDTLAFLFMPTIKAKVICFLEEILVNLAQTDELIFQVLGLQSMSDILPTVLNAGFDCYSW